MPRKNPPAKWVLPTVVDPPERKCIKIQVPDEQFHIAAFRGALLNLCAAYKWADDTAHTAREVALIWREIIDSMEWGCGCMTEPFLQFRLNDCVFQYSITSGEEWLDMPDLAECIGLDVRQSEENPCTLEKSIDGGETWDSFANLQLCPPKIRNNGGKLQWNNPATDEWEDVPDQGDEREDGEAPPPTPVEGESMPCLSALNVMSVYSTAFSQARAGVVGGEYAVAIGATVTGVLSLFIPAAIISTICLTIAGMALSLAEAGLDDLLSTETTDTLKCILNDNAGEDGSYNSSQFNSIQSAVDTEYSGLKASIINHFFDALGPVGLTRAAGLGGITTGDCSDCDDVDLCVGAIFDFTVDEQGFRLANEFEMDGSFYVVGEYVSGAWKTTADWNGQKRLRIIYEPENVLDLTDQDLYVEATIHKTTAYDAVQFFVWGRWTTDGSWHSFQVIDFSGIGGTGDYTRNATYTGNPVQNYDAIALDVYFPDSSGQAYVTRFECYCVPE